MQILRHFIIRSLLFAALFAALALPPEVVATTSNETTSEPIAHKTTTKKAVKKAPKKTTRKAGKKPRKTVKNTGKQTGHKIDKKVVKPATLTGEYVIAAKDGVNVLANPANDAEVRWEIFKGFPLMVKKRQGQWLQVGDFEGDTGWIHESLVSSAEKSVIVCKKRSNLRQDPGDKPGNPIIALIRYGVVFTPIEKKDDWLKVRYEDNTEGWLNKDAVWPSNALD